MFAIRRAQLRLLEDASEDQFVRAVAASLRQRHAQLLESIDEDALIIRVGQGIKAALEHGLEHEVSIAIFVGLQFIIGPEFYFHPPIASVLNGTAGSADERLAAAIQKLAPAVWGDARRANRTSVYSAEQ